jgi:hypothetical protein
MAHEPGAHSRARHRFQKFEPHTRLTIVWARSGQPEVAQPYQPHIGEARQPQPELAGPPAVATDSVGKQTQLRFLDPVLFFASRTINGGVKFRRSSGEFGVQEASAALIFKGFP